MRKSYFKRGCALCLAVALVVSGGLYAASDRSLKANEENNVYQETELSSAENGPGTVVQELEVPDEDTDVDAEGSDKADAAQESAASGGRDGSRWSGPRTQVEKTRKGI